MKKVLLLFLLALGTFMIVRWDHIKEPLENLENRALIFAGFAEEDPPLGYYILTERTAVKTDGGVRAVPLGTEVRLISQQNTVANVDDGISSFEVLISKLSRDPKLRTGPRYQSKRIADNAPVAKPLPDSPEDGTPKGKLASQIKVIDDKLLELAASLRELSKFDLQKGHVEKGEEAVKELHKQIAAYEAERDQLKREMHKLP